MAFALSPVTQFGTKEKAARLYYLVTEISNSTSSNEPECRAYCWFWDSSLPAVTAADSRTRQDNESGGIIRLRGFEVYANEEALTLVHRSSEPYKAMRKAIVDEELYLSSKLPDITFVAPVARFGGLNINGNRIDFAERHDVRLVVTEFKGLEVSLEDSLMNKLSEVLADITDNRDKDDDTAADNVGLLTYFVTKTEVGVAEDSAIIDVLLFECFESLQRLQEVWEKSKVHRDEASLLAKEVVVTCWEHGIGFIRG